MRDMGKHASNDRALRRARVAAWTVFISMAGTTMTFQVYHSIKVGRMPWELAGLYGVVPLLISICILEIVAEWEGAPAWAKYAAYAIMGGSMFMSASATGAVVLHAAAPHWSLLFGLLLDAAALLSVHFLLNGPRPLSKIEAAEVSAHRAAIEAERSAAETERAGRADAEAALSLVRAELTEAVARAEAEAANAETLTRKLESTTGRKQGSVTGRKRGAATGRKPEPVTGSAAAPEEVPEEAPADLDNEAKVLWYLDRGNSASQAGILAGLSDSRGRQIARLRKDAPHEPSHAERDAGQEPTDGGAQ